MWARKMSAADHAQNKFCITCHEKGKCAEKNIPGQYSHQTGIELTDDMTETQLPLYDKSGHKKPDALIACMTCHNLHDPGPVTTRHDKGKITEHSSFLRLNKNGLSGPCINCHKDQKLINNTVHDLALSDPEYRNAKGLNPAEAGSCSGCHAAHNTQNKVFLWAAPLETSEPAKWNNEKNKNHSIMNKLCTGCHTKDGIASRNNLEYGLHPAELTVPSGISNPIDLQTLNNKFPLYNTQGEISSTGEIVCSTCHNPHQWNADLYQQGTSDKSDGNITNSFLRSQVSNLFCSGCHGLDGLFKYKYFHSPVSRDNKREALPF